MVAVVHTESLMQREEEEEELTPETAIVVPTYTIPNQKTNGDLITPLNNKQTLDLTVVVSGGTKEESESEEDIDKIEMDEEEKLENGIIEGQVCTCCLLFIRVFP